MSKQIDRRNWLKQSAAVSTVLATGVHSQLASAVSDSPSEKLNIASIGVGGRAAANLKGLEDENIVAIVDTDQNALDQAGGRYKQARKYRDFRVMLEKETNRVDAVLVSCADHTHAPAAAMAMRMKKHVYCEKPLAHTVYEARVLANLARENNLATQMGTQVHAGNNYRRVVELVQSGAIGEIREVHVWVGVNYSGQQLVTGKSAPKNVDWDLWQGPSPSRPYCETQNSEGAIENIYRFHWRWFWDYGTGGLGDFSCHYMDLAHWALELKNPTRVSASGPTPLLHSTTAGIVVDYDYPARGDLPPVKMTWYDGDKKPEILSQLKGKDGKPLNWGSGQLFIGSNGMIISDYSKHMLLPVDRFVNFQRPEPTIADSLGHHREWTHAIRTGDATTCNFEYSGALSESVLLGVASYRSGTAIEWDAENLKVTNSAQAQQWIHKEYRKGWTL